MKGQRQIIPIVGLLATVAVAVYMVVRLDGQQKLPVGDFTRAQTAEMRDAQGRVVLRGSFHLTDEEDQDIERRAILEPTGVDADAAGEVEVEFSTATPVRQEIEFSARHLSPGAVFTFVVDGVEMVTDTADRRGRVAVEIDLPRPKMTTSR